MNCPCGTLSCPGGEDCPELRAIPCPACKAPRTRRIGGGERRGYFAMECPSCQGTFLEQLDFDPDDLADQAMADGHG